MYHAQPISALQTAPIPPRPAEGIDLIGEYKGSGSREAPYLARRTDGQVVHLSRLLYLVAEAADGHRNFGEIAERVSREYGRTATAENVRFLVEKKLRPLGVIAAAEGQAVSLPRLDPMLGLKFRLGAVPAGVVRFLTIPLLPLFRLPIVLTVLGALVALDIWLIVFHGVLGGVSALINQPSLLVAFFVVEFFAMAWHECGHATACYYGGAKPGKVGAGIYLIWFVFYCDVTDSYRLDRAGRLRVDCGGLYFDAIFTLALAGAYFLTGFEPLLVLVLFNQLGALDELSPFLRLDGYYIISDITGVPDLFKTIRPTLASLVPGREADEDIIALRPWVRVVITLWVLAVVPALLIGLVVMVVYGPWVVAATWDSLLVQWGKLCGALQDGETSGVLLGMLNVVSLAVPVVGGVLFFSWIAKRWSARAWRWSRGRPLVRFGLSFVLVALASLSLLAVVGVEAPSLEALPPP